MFDVVYKRFDVEYKFKINKPKYLFLWCLFLTKKWVQNRVYRKGRLFLLWDWYEVCQVGPFYTTVVIGKTPVFEEIHFVLNIQSVLILATEISKPHGQVTSISRKKLMKFIFKFSKLSWKCIILNAVFTKTWTSKLVRKLKGCFSS